MNENRNLQKFAYSIQNETSLKSKEDQSVLTPYILYDPNEFLIKPRKNFTRMSNSLQESEESELELPNWKDRKDLEQSEKERTDITIEIKKIDEEEAQKSEKISKNLQKTAKLPSESRKKLPTQREAESPNASKPQSSKEKLPTGNKNDLPTSPDLPPPTEYQDPPSNSCILPTHPDEFQKESVNLVFPSSQPTQTQITRAPRPSRPRANLKVSFLLNQSPPCSSSPLHNSPSFKPSPTHPSKDALNARIFTIVSQFYLVTKFIRVLRNSTIYKSPKYLKKDNFSLINDLSFYLEGWKRNYNIYATDRSTQLNLLFLAVRWALSRCKLLKGVGKALRTVNVVFDPINPLRIAWDCMQMGLLVCFFMFIPVQIGFGVDLTEELGSFKEISFYLFLVDFLVNLNTAYYEKGELMKRRRRIVQHYLSQNLLKDLISFLYFSSFFQIGLSLLPTLVRDGLPLIFYLRFFTLRKILIRIQEYLLIEEKAYNRLSLLKVIVAIFFFSHVLACIWHYIGSLRQENWMTSLDIAQLSWVYRYLYSYYYVVVVMNTVGFGDIVPKNDLERVVAILFIYVACAMFAYTINSIGVIVQDLNKRNKEFNRSVSLVNGYMKQKKINFNLRIRVQKYLEYIWLEKSGQNEEETHKIINRLSKSLKEELLLSANGVIFKDLPLFYMNFSEETLRRVVYQIKEVSLVPGDMLFERDDAGEEKALYIVKKGEVEMMGEGMHVIRKVEEGGVCGEVSFFSGRSRECYARSSTFTSLYVLYREDFLHILSSNAHDYERFCEIKDKINVYQNVEDLYIRCPSCSREDHGVLCCPLLHLTLERQRIIARFTYSQNQERGETYRRDIRFYARKSFKNNSLAAFLINRSFKEKEKHIKEEEEECSSNAEDESRLSSMADDDARNSKRSFNYIAEYSNSNMMSNNENHMPNAKRTLNRSNSIVSEINAKGSLAFIDDGGGGGLGGGAGLGGGGGGEGQRMIGDKKHSSVIPANLINNLEKLLLNVPLARKVPGIVSASSEDPLGSLNEISKNYGCYFPHNNIKSIVNFIKKFYDSKQKHRRRSFMFPDDLAGGGKRMRRIETSGKRKTSEGDKVVKRRKKKREKRKEEGKGTEEKGRKEEEGVKRSFFSAFFDREREMMKHNGIVDREKIVAMLRRFEKKRKGCLERWCCFWRYNWK